MSLVNLVGGQAQPGWGFSHHQDHLEIAQAASRVLGKSLQLMPLDPVSDTPQWKRQHQAMHDAMNRALGLPQGRDFTGEMNDAWHDANWREHAAARAKLGI